MRRNNISEELEDEGQDDDAWQDEEEEEDKFQHLPGSSAIKALRPRFAMAAQKVYDGWVQDDDDELNGGGICHLIADQIAGIANDAGIPTSTQTSSHEVHVYCVSQCANGIFEIDVPWSLYERGGGYTWTKLEGVVFEMTDVVVSLLDGDPGNFGQYVDGYDD